MFVNRKTPIQFVTLSTWKAAFEEDGNLSALIIKSRAALLVHNAEFIATGGAAHECLSTDTP